MKNDNIIQVKRNVVFHDELPFFIQKHQVISFPLHWHDFYEIEFIYGNGISNVILDVPYVIENTACFLYMPHAFHCYEASGNKQDSTIYNIAFSESFVSNACMSKVFNLFKNNSIMANDGILSQLEFYVQRIYQIYDKEFPVNKLLIKSLLETMIYELCSASTVLNAYKNDNININIENQELLSYINCNFTENLRIKDLAELIHVSPNYFSTYFKKSYQITFRDYINQLRMKRAMDLLCYTDNIYSLNQICNAIGYESESNFIKAFIKYYGNHPSKYFICNNRA